MTSTQLLTRRRVLSLLAGSTMARGLAIAQSLRKPYRVALLFGTNGLSEMVGPNPLHPSANAFVHGLRDQGFVEGSDLILERRSADGHLDRFPAIIADLDRQGVSAVVAVGYPELVPTIRATPRVAFVVVPAYFDLVQAGLVDSLARPGHNVTGLSITTTPETEAKRLEFLRSVVPHAKRVAFLCRDGDLGNELGAAVQDAARHFGLALIPALTTTTDHSAAFAAIAAARVDALLVANTPTNFAYRDRIVEFTKSARLPAMFSRKEYAEAGGLMSYGVDITDLFRRAAAFVRKLSDGATPADLPVEQPTRFELVINTKTAKFLGIGLSNDMLTRADRLLQ